ncbi:uncharacterized protein LOC114786361 [Denticeps clupeoides]|uniref:uncharacterized protein LOC114786361 n=1 Tax=Denticeps clupeoides TaxID=299321 RepID=UPI0010A3D7CC|nr:uncharacterized protein LOC114786361 [Denticeps clupeoides]
MNLYRNFGSLMETWVAEGRSALDSDGVGIYRFSEGPTRSESKDSGMETVSAGTPTQEAPDEEDACSPVARRLENSSSPSLFSIQSLHSSCTSRMSQGPPVEQALRPTDPAHSQILRHGPPPPNCPGFRGRSKSVTVPAQSRGVQKRGTGQRSSSLQQTPKTGGQRLQTDLDRISAEQDLEAQDNVFKELSPGLLYLEEVCHALERIAHLQIQNRGLEMKMEVLQNRQYEQWDAAASSSRCRTASFTGNRQQPERRRDQLILPGFRRRAASDTASFTGRLSGRSMTNRVEDLPEEPEEEHPVRDNVPQQGRFSKIKIGSLKRNEAKPDVSARRSQTVPAEAKKTSMRRLGSVFKKK